MKFRLKENGMRNPLFRFYFRWIYLPLMTQDYVGEYEKNLIVYYKDRLTLLTGKDCRGEK